MKTFHLPDLGEGLTEAEIVAWHVQVGEVVKTDQPLVSMETAKAVVEVPAPWSGRVTRLHGQAGDIIPTHAPLVDFEDPLEVSPATRADAPKPAAPPPRSSDPGTVVGQMPAGENVVEERAIIRRKIAERKRVKALPKVRRRARELGIDLSRVPSTGRHGETTLADLESRNSASASPATPSRQPLAVGQPERLRGTRRAMAQVMAQARDAIAATTLFDDADLDHWTGHSDVTARVIRAIIVATRAEPTLNAWFNGETLEQTIHDRLDLGLAVDTPDGLIVPVLRDIGRADPDTLRHALDRVKEKTRERTLQPADLAHPTFTLSNFGMLAGRYATPIVVPPTVAILGVGRLCHDVVAVLGGIATHRRLPLSLSFDHRSVTGGDACRFLHALIEDLERAT
ncbi:dihydrolipoyllysine-residue acetyltransferase E2 component of pyruvate dehydrogenase complex [mine drainage metagenome]|uniref:Dihydrolipoyllysine-residue acetyltransferase E2 component of pyruvate dehydrogenase complex n=2 Tax=mine drainage metagenome TaxID=410659 RepID=T1BC55_9ZZZZ